MYIRNGIAYAGKPDHEIRIKGVRPLDDYKLWIRFTTKEEKIFDFKPLLDAPCYMPLRDKRVFNGVYIDYGLPVWNNGNIDIAPETLYSEGVPYHETAN